MRFMISSITSPIVDFLRMLLSMNNFALVFCSINWLILTFFTIYHGKKNAVMKAMCEKRE